jgi:uncharacterized membrane protein
MSNHYQLLKMLHIFGVIVFVGNIMVTALWKFMADRTREHKIIAFGQRVVSLSDFVFTGTGAVIVLVSGLLMAHSYAQNFITVKWIAWGLGLFMLSGIIWLTALIPIQIKQGQLANKFDKDGDIPEEYWRLGRLWIFLGVIATILPLINIYFMVFRPT